MSADARKRISEAQKARWAKQKAKGSASPTLTAAASGPKSARKKR
jgi:hypothetical protein